MAQSKLSLATMNSVPKFLPQGLYVVTRDFSIYYGGYWRLCFNAGDEIRSDGLGKIESKSIGSNSWQIRKPSISSARIMDFTLYGRTIDQVNVYNNMILSLKIAPKPIKVSKKTKEATDRLQAKTKEVIEQLKDQGLTKVEILYIANHIKLNYRELL